MADFLNVGAGVTPVRPNLKIFELDAAPCFRAL